MRRLVDTVGETTDDADLLDASALAKSLGVSRRAEYIALHPRPQHTDL